MPRPFGVHLSHQQGHLYYYVGGKWHTPSFFRLFFLPPIAFFTLRPNGHHARIIRLFWDSAKFFLSFFLLLGPTTSIVTVALLFCQLTWTNNCIWRSRTPHLTLEGTRVLLLCLLFIRKKREQENFPTIKQCAAVGNASNIFEAIKRQPFGIKGLPFLCVEIVALYC